MEVRDKYGTIESFSNLIEEESGFIVEVEKTIERLKDSEIKGIQLYPRPNLDVLEDYKAEKLYYKYDILLASYSVGKDIREIEKQYKDIVPLVKRSWKLRQDYVMLLHILSMGILLQADTNIFRNLANVVTESKLNDFLIDYLIGYKLTDYLPMSEHQFKWKRPYPFLDTIISVAQTNKEEAVKQLKLYLTKKWYRGHSDTGWYNIHVTNSGSHSGYWSFESGALVKVLGLDDSSLKDLPYYPYDMVHWNDTK